MSLKGERLFARLCSVSESRVPGIAGTRTCVRAGTGVTGRLRRPDKLEESKEDDMTSYLNRSANELGCAGCGRVFGFPRLRGRNMLDSMGKICILGITGRSSSSAKLPGMNVD